MNAVVIKRKLNPKKATERTPVNSRFDATTIENMRQDIMAGRFGKTDKVTMSDDKQEGLRAIIRRTGLVTFHAHYSTGDGGRPYLKVGYMPQNGNARENQKAIDEAREVTAVIVALAKKGVDVQEGLHERLIRELREKGDKWRP